jgi:UDP-N-acetylmuramoyl-L-alanyl-D-glutamate--2,6-diaminopimelate ligase
MRLGELVAEANLQGLGLLRELRGDSAVEIDGVTMDSRRVAAGYLFACVPGQTSDGHQFAWSAVSDGARALMCERLLDLDVPQVIVTSVRPALGPVASAFFGKPSEQLTVAGVTGTNGKTTTCAFLASIFETHGWPSTTIGTLTQSRTTPEAPELQGILADWLSSGGRAVAMEVSSHALDQHRTDAVHFAAAVFTNLSPEHLDFHQTMDRYFEAKARLFEPGRADIAVVNRSDPWGRKLIEGIEARGGQVEAFSADDATEVELRPAGSEFTWERRRIAISVGGRFNVVNALAAASCARALGIDPATIADGLAAVRGVEGRFQLVDAGQPFTVVVDYAHTPDGLSKILTAAREICQGRLIVVFGAGGDRDHEKRPLMGATVAELADLAVVTSDNPRSEDPDAIIAEIVAGAEASVRGNLSVYADRGAAIATTLSIAQPGDVVVIAGKGHEKGQEIGGRILPFDDVDVARTALARILASRRDDG